MHRTILAITLLALAVPAAQADQTDLLNRQRGIVTTPNRDFGATAREQSRQSQQQFQFDQTLQTDQLQRRIQRQGDRLNDNARQQLGRRPNPFTN